MFFTQAQLALPALNPLSSAGTQLWREVGLATHRAWFLATFAVGQSGECETVCVSWDLDLVRRIEEIPNERLTSLLCLQPSQRSRREGWSARNIASIWRGYCREEVTFVFVDSRGEELCGGMIGRNPSTVHRRRLVTVIDSKADSLEDQLV
jgi:hypothetical protein